MRPSEEPPHDTARRARGPPLITGYRERLVAREAVLAARERAHANFSRARLAIVFIALAVVVAGGFQAAPLLVWPLAAFGILVVLHARALNERQRAQSAVAFYRRAIDRANGQWIGRGEPGDRFRQPDHLYAEDLDIFGRGSLFELLSTARTRAGEETLARWLLEPAPLDDVRLRQEAIRELGGRLDLREQVAILGDGLRVGVNAESLRRWAAAPVQLRGGTVRLALAAVAASTVALAIFAARSGHVVPLLVALVVQGSVAAWFKSRVLHVVESVTEPSHDLDLFADVLRLIERERFESARLRALVDALGGGHRPASAAIARLDQLVALLSSRSNVMFAIPAAMMLWATQFAFAIERWRELHGQDVVRWLDAIGEFEALSALATFASEHRDYAMPVFAEPGAPIVAAALAHPLLPQSAVANDIALGGAHPHLLIVSGSNMSGKSTLLRALGTNVVLALAGAPVRARRFELPPSRVGASIRIVDSLQDGRSRFFAEITRLKQIVDLAREGTGQVLFLLDEILAGTNSHDRRQGAAALLAGLVDLGAVGLVTTHDLALGDIAEHLRGRAANVHFEDRFGEGRLSFDYTLRPGVVQTSNAIELMRSIGLDV